MRPRRLDIPLLLALVLFLVAAAFAQAPAPGRLLVSTEALAGSDFAESVVLLLEHDDRGATGLIVNRPTWVAPADAFPELDYVGARAGPLYLGGPVAHTNVVALVRGSVAGVSGVHRVLEGVYFADRNALRDLANRDDPEQEIRLYAGLSSWEPGQLQREIDGGAWHVTVAQPSLVFSGEPGRLWQRLSERLSELLASASPRT
jgi:putative transcriptional regulator